MTLDQLRVFVAVAEQEHVTRASIALGLTQSAVSAAIAALEARHATALFHRVGRRIELTDAGRIFLPEARSVLARAEAASLVLAELSTMRRGTLAVSASQTLASYWLPPYLVRFRALYPDIHVQMMIGNTAQVAASIVEGGAQLGFVEGRVDSTLLSKLDVGGDRLVLVVGSDHQWATHASIASSDLLDAEWVLREAGSGTRSEFEAALQQRGISPRDLRVALELPSNEAVRAAVEAGLGVTAISDLVVDRSIRLGTLRRVAFDLAVRPFHALFHVERYKSQAAEALLRLIGRSSQPLPAAPRRV